MHDGWRTTPFGSVRAETPVAGGPHHPGALLGGAWGDNPQALRQATAAESTGVSTTP